MAKRRKGTPEEKLAACEELLEAWTRRMLRASSTACKDELLRVLVIMQWTAMVSGTVLGAPQVTPENEGGVGLLWRDPISRRELDLDYTGGKWHALKTSDGEALKGDVDADKLDEIVLEADIESDADLVELARWFVGSEAPRRAVPQDAQHAKDSGRQGQGAGRRTRGSAVPSEEEVVVTERDDPDWGIWFLTWQAFGKAIAP